MATSRSEAEPIMTQTRSSGGGAADELRAWWSAQVDRIVELACDCAVGGDARWDALLCELGIGALPPAERLAHVHAIQIRGAVPIEVQWALERVGRQTAAAARKLQFTPGVDEGDALDRLELDASRTAEQQLPKLLARVRGAASTSSIFARASASTPRIAATAAGVGTLACASCGAPRRGHTERSCSHCGGAL
jgi:hypothetical protein